jgi:hypothetical protein
VRLAPLAVVCLALGMAAHAPAADWGTITPGTTTQPAVRAHYGAPTRTETPKVEGYDTATWTYEGAQAPAGLVRMVVEFGLLTPGGYKADVVRALRLEPKPGIFNRPTVVNGWGPPTGTRQEKEADIFVYQEGLLVYFDRDSWDARLLIFTPPQPPPPPGR